MESVVLDQPARTAQADLKRHFTQKSESTFTHVASHIQSIGLLAICNVISIILWRQRILLSVSSFQS